LENGFQVGQAMVGSTGRGRRILKGSVMEALKVMP
jgi:hypothetical protein